MARLLSGRFSSTIHLYSTEKHRCIDATEGKEYDADNVC